ncbi:DUF3265 domain-containing protein [Vibrio splendidus]|nr:DUF3265 domain-containing protein [Vibrio splendidus]
MRVICNMWHFWFAVGLVFKVTLMSQNCVMLMTKFTRH